ncbi:unnamed protein product [Diamesa hyperborea]
MSSKVASKKSRTKSISSRVSSKDSKNVYKTDKKRVDRNEVNTEFTAFEIAAKEVSTVILLLDSEEFDVVEKALYHLDKFGVLSDDNLNILFEKNILNSLLKDQLYKSENIIIQKFTFKILVQFFSNSSDYKKKLLTHELVQESQQLFVHSNDNYLVEYTAIILRHACEDPKKMDSLGKNEDFMKVLFNRITKSDNPDIILNCLLLLNFLMSNSMVIEQILQLSDFPVLRIQKEITNEYQEIKVAALKCLDLITDCRNNPFEADFSSPSFIETLFLAIEDQAWKDLHKLVFKVISNLVHSDEISLKIIEKSYFKRLLNLFFDKENAIRECVLEVITTLAAKFSDIRRQIQENGIVSEIIELFNEVVQTSSGSEAICQAIVVMSQDYKILDEILTCNIYSLLMRVVKNESKSLDCRIIALQAFCYLICRRGINYLLENSIEYSDYLADVLNSPYGEFPLGFMIAVNKILEKISDIVELKGKYATIKFAESIFKALENSSRSTILMIELFNLSSLFISEFNFQQVFVKSKIDELIKYHLYSPAVVLQTSVCSFIRSCANHKSLCEKFIEDGILQLLLDDMNSSRCSMCSAGKRNILDHDLSVKLAICGKLEVRDKIESGFYATKRGWLGFMNLREIMRKDLVNPLYPIYSINFTKKAEEKRKSKEYLEQKVMNRKLLYDQELMNLIEGFCNDEDFAVKDYVEKIKAVAQKVSKHLQTQDDCISHQLEVNLNELKFKFQSSVLPIGSLVYGKSFEAALLFKSLADQLNIEATLVTDKITGKAWNEVCHQVNIVDLFSNPGDLYERSSVQARIYLNNIS